MGFLGTNSNPSGFPPNTADPQWARTAVGRFPLFVQLDPEEAGLSGKSGVLVVWHGGVKPAWVWVGASNDLAATIHELAKDDDLMYYDLRGRLFVSWSMIKPDFQPGVVRFLNEHLKPIIDNPAADDIKADPIPVYPPAYQP